MNKTFGFKVSINKDLICKAGFEHKNAVTTCILDAIKRKNENVEQPYITISGLDSDNHQRVGWHKGELKEGDKITIEIINSGFDAPVSINKTYTEEEVIGKKLKAYKKLREELKDYLEE